MHQVNRRARQVCARAANSVVVETLETRQLLAGVSFSVSFVNSDAYSGYFNQVRTALTAAGMEWAKYFDGKGAVIDLEVDFQELPEPTLAQAAPDMVFFRDDGDVNVYEPSAVREIRTGVDPDKNEPDGFVTIDVGNLSQLHFGSMPIPSSKLDAFTLLTHELGHVFGFTGYADDQTGQVGSTASRYDLFINGNGGRFYFTGPAAKLAYGGNVPLATGSVHHYGNPSGPGADLDGNLMSVSMGPGRRTFVSPLDLAILKDIGMPILGDSASQTVLVRATDLNASEQGPDHGKYRFERTGDVNAPLTVTYTIGGTATNGSDYNTLTGTVVIPAGQAFVDVALTVKDDTAVEGNETVVLSINPSANYEIGASPSASITIIDNDGGTGTDTRAGVYLRALDAEAGETRGGLGILRFYRTGGLGTAVSVNYTVSGSAVAGTDYFGLNGIVTIPSTALFADVVVRAIDDTLVEGAENVVVTIKPDDSYRIAGQSTAGINVLDNDGTVTAGTMITGTVFNDLNGDGRKTPDDKALFGWLVWLDTDADGVLDAGERRTSVNGAGKFVFDGIAAGTYNVTSMPTTAEWRRSSPTGRSQAIQVTDGQAVNGVNFGFTKSARVAGRVFDDRNRDGETNGNDYGLGNWYVYVDANNNGVFDKGEKTARTNAKGYYAIDGLGEGTHTVRLFTKFGWDMTVRTPASIMPLSLGKAQVMGSHNFSVGRMQF